MRLFLLRHAEASYDAPTDPERELTPKGEKSIKQLCKFLSRKDFAGLHLIHHSGYVRARQTAELFRDGLLPELALAQMHSLTPEDDPRLLGDFLQSAAGDQMLVGHNPNLSLLTAWLLTGNPLNECIDFKKSGLLCLERGAMPTTQRPGGIWNVKWFITKKLFGSE
ncbi:MAG: phosphohistidine phosphatase SixA [Puniceicoccales bacterium]